MVHDFANLVESSETIAKAQKGDPFKPVRQYLEICDLVRKELEKDKQLLEKHRALLSPDIHYTGNYGALLTQDFIYCTTDYLSDNSLLSGSQLMKKRFKIDISIGFMHLRLLSQEN